MAGEDGRREPGRLSRAGTSPDGHQTLSPASGMVLAAVRLIFQQPDEARASEELRTLAEGGKRSSSKGPKANRSELNCAA